MARGSGMEIAVDRVAIFLDDNHAPNSTAHLFFATGRVVYRHEELDHTSVRVDREERYLACGGTRHRRYRQYTPNTAFLH